MTIPNDYNECDTSFEKMFAIHRYRLPFSSEYFPEFDTSFMVVERLGPPEFETQAGDIVNLFACSSEMPKPIRQRVRSPSISPTLHFRTLSLPQSSPVYHRRNSDHASPTKLSAASRNLERRSNQIARWGGVDLENDHCTVPCRSLAFLYVHYSPTFVSFIVSFPVTYTIFPFPPPFLSYIHNTQSANKFQGNCCTALHSRENDAGHKLPSCLLLHRLLRPLASSLTSHTAHGKARASALAL